MINRTKYSYIIFSLAVIILIVVSCFGISSFKTEKISFNSQVRPILNAKCTGCHGGVKKAGGISFIYRELALGKGESGLQCIVPGDPDNSEFIKRLTHHDIELKMPLGKEPLNEKEIATLKKWIKEGANWEEHWAYVAPKSQKIPDVSSKYVSNEIDNFIIEKRSELDIDLNPSPEASKETLLRRLSLDLIGLPPSIESMEAFLADKSENAYEKQVDRLLALPQYGEKWAGMWLDLSRYADTKGYEKDHFRNIWRYRDYLIKSFNKNKPYNHFLIEQLAGDLLPNRTDEQILATAFHRNTLTNDEGGTDDEEFRTAAVIDRVNTTFDVTQGITMGCVQCHSHPYDPIDHKEYYQFMAFMNNTADEDLFDDLPNYISKEDTPTVKINELMLEIDKLSGYNSSSETYKQKKFRHSFPKIQAEDFTTASKCSTNAQYLVINQEKSYVKYSKIDFTRINSIKLRAGSKGGSVVELRIDSPTGMKISEFELQETFGEWFESGNDIKTIEGKHDLFLVFKKNKNGFCNSEIDYILIEENNFKTSKQKRLATEYAEGYNVTKIPNGIFWKENGWIAYKNLDLSKSKFIATYFTAFGGSKIEFRKGSLDGEIIGIQHIQSYENEYKLAYTPIKPISGLTDIYIIFKKNEKGFADGVIKLFDFQSTGELNKYDSNPEIQSKKAELRKYLYAKGTPVLQELPKSKSRVTRVFHRGNWMAKTDTVQPNVPHIFNKMPKDAPNSRLGMAMWLTSKENPLTARVAVNRFWEQLFGYGIVETLEDFGTQGAKPTHPELLDFLALKFQNEMNWDMKKLLKYMVMSSTYKQSSEVTVEHLKLDSRNRYLARAPRVRLSSEQIRDQALAVSGLLSPKMYGPSVMPYQPEGIWQTVYNGANWETSPGEDRYRRMLYTFVRRSAPYPNMITFDAPSREICMVRRIRTNTPLQALATLNDTTFIEASQALAKKMVAIKDTSIKKRIAEGYKMATLKDIDPKSIHSLLKLYAKANSYYAKTPIKAYKMSGTNQGKSNELASLTLVANAILNTDEFITKE